VTFEDFLNAELEGLGRYAQVLTGERQEAHDTLAEAMVKVQLHWHRIGVMTYPLAYVRRILTNQFLQNRRSWASRMLRSTGPEALPQQQVWDSGPQQDLPDADIADALSCSEGAVRTYISRGLAALRLHAVDEAGERLATAPRPGW
jgi:DNA-directed RNA polymerase specialized sigma24 family protein